MKIQELNQDGSARLDDNGKPIYQYVPDAAYYELMETPIGQKRWKRVTELKTETANGLIEGPKGFKKVEPTVKKSK